EAGVEPEQRVAIVLPDGVEFVAAFIGAMKIGAVPVPLNTFASLADQQQLIEISRARVVVSSIDLGPKRIDPQTLFASSTCELETFPTGVDEPCYWLFSSGTTGQPKGVVHLHGDMLACVAPFAQQVVSITPEDRTFSVPRLFFSYGLV